jgi:glycosyltransferase involved in cell wall biosynthesis
MGSLSRYLAFYRNARYLFNQAKGDTIILQYGSPFSTHIAVLLGYKKSNTYLIEYSTVGIQGFVKQIVWTLLRRKVCGVICPSEEVGEKFSVPYCIVPDYIYTGTDFNFKSSYYDKEYDFCVIGRLNKDKGIIEIISALKGKGCSVLIAGKPDSQEYHNYILQSVKGASNIELHLDYLSEIEYQSYINQSRYAILNYQLEYSNRSSGVVFDTLFAGLPVIGNRCRTLQFIEDNGLGMICDDLNNIDLNLILNESFYNKCLVNIADFCINNKKNSEKLASFIKQNNKYN